MPSLLCLPTPFDLKEQSDTADFRRALRKRGISDAPMTMPSLSTGGFPVLTPAADNAQMLNTLSFLSKPTAGNSLYPTDEMISV